MLDEVAPIVKPRLSASVARSDRILRERGVVRGKFLKNRCYAGPLLRVGGVLPRKRIIKITGV